ncbi:MAG: type II secretion system protein [Betaproteobacteria bacterium]
MFIIIVSVGVAGILTVFNRTVQKSADPQIRKQMLAIAESLLEEVTLKPFTYCDPDDPQAGTAQSAAVGVNGCTAAAAVENIGPESTAPYGPETRLGATTPFDNVNDYDGLSLSPYSDINGNTITGYTASVSVVQQQLEASIPAADSLRVTVTVTRGSDSLSLSGYRLRYAPRSLP